MFPELLKLDLQQCPGRRPPSAERSAALSKNVNVLHPVRNSSVFTPDSAEILPARASWNLRRLCSFRGQAPPPRFQDKHGGGEAVTPAAAELCQFCSLEDGEADIWFMVKWLSW